jgi:hypothetical protein
MQSYKVIITFRSGDTYDNSFRCAESAARFMREQASWEECVKVQCAELGIEYPGDFVPWHTVQ